MDFFSQPEGPFANPGRDAIRNPDKPQHPGGHPTVPLEGTHPGHPGLGHGHQNPNDPRADRMPVQDFLGNTAMPDGVIPGQPRW
jgi:hypothetical protein